nr:MAG: RNA-dependent RNA polymerase [Chuviridae sp.]
MAAVYAEHGQRDVAAGAWDMIYDRKFNVALRRSHGDKFKHQAALGKLSADHELLVAMARRVDPDFAPDRVKVNVNLFPRFYRELVDNPVRFDEKGQRIWKLVTETVNVQLGWNTERWAYRDQPHLQRRTSTAISNASRSAVIERLASELPSLTSLVHKVGRRVRPRRDTESKEEYLKELGKSLHAKMFRFNYTIVWSENSCLVRYRGDWYFYAKPYILLIHNKLCDILSVVVYAALTPYETYRWNLLYATTDFLEAWSDCAQELNQGFFRVSKLLEAVGIGMTLRDVEGEKNEQFLETVRKSTIEHLGMPLSFFRFYKVMDMVPIEVRHELMCLSKTMGHPFCDVEQGAMDLKKKVTAEKDLDPDCILESVRRAKEDFVRHYYRRHRKWPLCELAPETPLRVTKVILHNLDPFAIETLRRYGGIPLECYDYITFKKLREFEWLENFIPYIKDRTISLVRSKVLEIHFDPEADKRVPWQDTRLLLFYLLSPVSMVNHVKYMHSYLAGQWEMLQDYLIIRVVPKEKEHKIEARGFGCKTYEDRARSIVQEYNTATILHEYSSEHVMTLDELGLAKKLLAFRSMSKAYRGYRMLILSVDASAWNNAFRGEAIHPMMEETLDKFFDVPLWSKTQTAYERSFIYVPDVDKIHSWDGQAGGIEGLNQYTWVYAYIHQMKVCLRDQPYPYYILCKGDDLRVAVLVAPEYLDAISIDVLKVQLLESVASIGKKFGHTIKVEDSYASESYFAFSKDAYVEGVEQSQAMRKVQKCYGANNAFINILDEYVASAFSNAHSASKVAPSPVTCYMVGCWWAFTALLGDKRYAGLSDWELVACMLVPNILGGFPIIYLHNMFTRAESDLLPPFVDLCRYCNTHYPQLATVLQKAWRQKISPVRSSLPGLMMDIYSLPITKPTSATTILRKEMSKLLQDKTENEALLALFRAANRGMERNLIAAYLDANVYNVKLMSALYDCLPEAIIRELVRKFESGKSIYLALLKGRGHRRAQTVVRSAYRADMRVHAFRIALVTTGVIGARSLLPDDWEQRCPGELCATLRSDLWEKQVIGVTQPPPQHQVYGGWIDRITPTYYTLRNHFELWHIHPSGDKPHLLSIGTCSPFVGAITGRGLSKPQVELRTQNIVSMKLHTLLDVYQWSRVSKVYEDTAILGNLWVICGQLIEDYTGRPVSAFLPYAGDTYINKTMQHHLRAHNYRASIVPNTLLNIYTTMQGNIYAHYRFKNSIDHYKINYLQIMCHMVSLVALPWWCGDGHKLTPRVWGVSTNCTWCLEPLDEEPVVLLDTDIGCANLANILRVAPNEIDQILHELDTQDTGPVYEPMDSAEEGHLELARQGLCEYITTTTWSQKMVLQTATQHHMTATSANVLAAWHGDKLGVSFSVQDIRSIGCEALLHAIAPIVEYHIYSEFPSTTELGALADMSSSPGEELPWFTLLLTVEHAMMLYELQQVLRSKQVDCQLRTVATAKALVHQFGHFCFVYAKRLGVPRTWIVLSYDREVNLPAGTKARLDSMRFKQLDATLGVMLRYARANEMPEQIIQVTERMLALALSDDEGFSLQIPSPGLEGRPGTLFPPLDDVTTFLLADMIPKSECDHPSVDAAGMEMVDDVYLPHGLVRTVMQRYQLGWVTSQVFFSRIMINAVHYTNTRPLALADLQDPGIIIYHLDPVTCLNTVKLHATSGDDYPEEIIDAAPAVAIDITDVHGSSISLRCGRVESVRAEPELDNVPLRETNYDNPVLTRASLCRTVGVGNQSMSKALSVFQQLRVATLPENGLYACLGDGYGGYTAIVSSLTKHSRIIYNTLPEVKAAPPIPIESEVIAIENDNTIDSSNIVLDVYDLTADITVQSFINHYNGVTLFTCDAESTAEVGSRYTANREAVIRNVCRMFVHTGRQGCILILKVYTYEYKLWMNAAQNLAPVCSQINMLHNRVSYNDGEIYLVAQLVEQDKTWKYDTGIFPPQIQCQRIERFCGRILARYEQAPPDHLTYENLFSAHHCELFKRLPCYGWSKIVEITKISLPNSLIAPHGATVDGWRRTTLAVLDSVSRSLKDQIMSHAAGARAFTYDTLTHKVILAERVVMLRGARLAIDMLTSTAGELIDELIVGEIVDVVAEVAAGMHATHLVEELTRGPCQVHGINVNLQADWIQGVRLGISIASYTLCLIAPPEDYASSDDDF